jgi:hypothetical protein
MTRTRAASLHFAICLTVASLLLCVFLFVWYPDGLFEAVGGMGIFWILVGVDVVLGPLLTFVVFRRGKPSLKFDLTVIALLQVAALGYGVYTLLIARPVYIASLGHRFDVVQANEIEEEDAAKSGKKLSWVGPEWVGTKSSPDPKEREKIMFGALGGIDYGHFPQHHQPLDKMSAEIIQRADKISELKKLNPDEEAAIDRWLEKRGVKADEVIYQGLKARAKDMAVIMDAKTAKVIGIAPFKPWP